MADYKHDLEPIEGINVSVSGGKEETDFTKNVVSNEIKRNVERWSKFSKVNMLNINIERHDTGGRIKYSVKMEATGDGAFHADSHDWSLENAMHEALERMGKELLKKKEKISSVNKPKKVFVE